MTYVIGMDSIYNDGQKIWLRAGNTSGPLGGRWSRKPKDAMQFSTLSSARDFLSEFEFTDGKWIARADRPTKKVLQVF